MTVKQQLDVAIRTAKSLQNTPAPDGRPSGAGGRELALAVTKMEEAQMWFTRALSIRGGNHAPADLEER